MVNHLLETRHPLSSSPVPLCVRPVFRSFLYLLTSLPPYFLFSVHTSKFRIPQILCLPLLRKYPGVWGHSSHFGTQRSRSFLHYPLPTTHCPLSSCTLIACSTRKTFNERRTPPSRISSAACSPLAMSMVSTLKANPVNLK